MSLWHYMATAPLKL